MTTLHLAAEQTGIDVERRRITGAIVEYGAIGFTSMGRTIFEAGSITAPDEARRVKLLLQHDTQAAAVGTMSAFTDDPRMPTASFTLPEGAEGDRALLEASDGRRDGLSVGVTLERYRLDDDVLVVEAARLYEVSLVTIPAFENARVSDVAAARKELTTMPQHTTEQAEATVAAAAASTPAPAEVHAAAPAAASTEIEQQAPAPMLAASQRRLDLRAVSAMIGDQLRTGQPAASIAAALTDITPTSITPVGEDNAVLRPQYVDELWQASLVQRPLIDSLNHAPLRSLKVYGFRFDVKPTVGDYAGDKAAVPSSNITTKQVEATAKRKAGAWDFDRAFVDLGAEGFIERVLQYATDDYRLQTEADVAAEIVAAATALPNSPTLIAALATIGAEAAKLGSNLSFVQFASDVWADFVQLPDIEVPWWLRQQGSISLSTTDGQAGGIRLGVNTGLPAGTVLAGDRRAATVYEVDPPVRARALDLPNGGVDVGVFGYIATLIHDSRALFKTSIVEPVA